MAKRFVYYKGSIENFKSLSNKSDYDNSIVFINGEGTSGKSAIYTHGYYFSGPEEYQAFLNTVVYVNGASINGTTVVPSEGEGGGGYLLPFTNGATAEIAGQSKKTTTITVADGKIQINLDSEFITAVSAAVAGVKTLSLNLGDKDSTSASENGSAFSQIKWLKEQIGTGGGVASQIQDAIDAITGTLGTDDAKTLEAINDELDDIIGKITPISSGYNSIAQQVDELETLVGQNAIAAAVTVEKQSSAESGYAATYVVKQGGLQVGDKINIPKDQFLKAATLVKGTWSNDTFTPSDTGTGKAIKLEMMIDGSDSDTAADILYINVADLVDVYTAKANAGEGEVQIAISDDNVVSATLVDKAVTTAKIKDLAVTEAKLGASAVTTAKIKDANVTLAKLDNTTTTTNSVTDKLVYKVTWASSGNIPATTSTQIRGGAAVMMQVNDSYYPARYINRQSGGYLLECVVNNRIYILTVANSATSSGHSFTGNTGDYEVVAENLYFTDTNNHYATDTVAAALVELGWELGWEELS